MFLVGVLFLTISFASRRQLSNPYLPGGSTALALCVAVEFIAGALLAYIGISNLIFDIRAFDWSLAAATVFGLLLIMDSLFLYRKEFKQAARGDDIAR